MGMRFVNLPKSKNFNITTRFYDPQKEAMKEREERIRKELEGNTSEGSDFHYGASIKGSFRNAGKINSKTVSEMRRKSNKRILYILVALLALLYFFLK
jgi:hypothetical protein